MNPLSRINMTFVVPITTEVMTVSCKFFITPPPVACTPVNKNKTQRIPIKPQQSAVSTPEAPKKGINKSHNYKTQTNNMFNTHIYDEQRSCLDGRNTIKTHKKPKP